MMNQRASSRYARALLELALERGQLDTIEEELLKMRSLLEKHPEIRHLVLNSTIALSEKEDFLDKVLGTEVSSLVIHFLKLLVKKGRFREFPAIQKDFHRQYEERRGVQEVTVLSSRELFPQAREKIHGLLKQMLGSDVRLNCQTDASLIGGLIIRFADKEIDTSYKSGLQEIKYRLLS